MRNRRRVREIGDDYGGGEDLGTTAEAAALQRRALGIDNNNRSVRRGIRAQGLENDDGGVGRGSRRDDAPE